MSALSVDLPEDLVALLRQSNQSADKAAREAIVLELYRRGTLSSGKAASLLGIDRFAFIARASSLGIPYLDMTEDEWEAERRRSQGL